MNLRLFLASAFCFVVAVVVRYDTDDYKRFLTQVQAAMALAGVTFKEACFAMQLDKGQLSRALSGEIALHAHRLAMLGAACPQFLQAWAVVLVRDHGLSPESQAAVKLARLSPPEAAFAMRSAS